MTLDQIDAINMAACRIEMLGAIAGMTARDLHGPDRGCLWAEQSVSGIEFMADTIAESLRAIVRGART